MGHSWALFLLFSSFQYNTVDRKSMFFKNLPVSGFEPRVLEATALPTEPQPLPVEEVVSTSELFSNHKCFKYFDLCVGVSAVDWV